MFANPSSIPYMLLLIAVKIVLGIAIGYLAILMYNLIFKKRKVAEYVESKEEHSHEDESHKHEDHEQEDKHEENKNHLEIHGGCCSHNVESKTFDWLHPMLHCIKIGLFILAINLVFGFITHIWVGEERLTSFLINSVYLQPLLAVLIGLIPNCASSVVITELFLIGGLSFGAMLAGLCVNAGLGLIMLLKANKKWKENLFVVIMLILPSLIVGYLFNFMFII